MCHYEISKYKYETDDFLDNQKVLSFFDLSKMPKIWSLIRDDFQFWLF